MEDLYRERVVDHYQHPRHFGTLEGATCSYEEENLTCGDTIRMDLQVEDGRIVDVRFSGQGCVISLAAASMLAERVHGSALEAAQGLSQADVVSMLGVPLGPARLRCAVLPLEALQGALRSCVWPE